MKIACFALFFSGFLFGLARSLLLIKEGCALFIYINNKGDREMDWNDIEGLLFRYAEARRMADHLTEETKWDWDVVHAGVAVNNQVMYRVIRFDRPSDSETFID